MENTGKTTDKMILNESVCGLMALATPNETLRATILKMAREAKEEMEKHFAIAQQHETQYNLALKIVKAWDMDASAVEASVPSTADTTAAAGTVPETPKKAKSCGIGALVGVIVNILVVCCYILLIFAYIGQGV